MPKSKRAQKVTLSKTQKKTHDRKQNIIDEVRQCADDYAAAYVVDAQNMRNSALKEVRRLLAGSSRLFFGRTKLLSSALGRTPADEHRDGLSNIAGLLHGQGECGLLFTNETTERVREIFAQTQVEEFARAGARATHTVELPRGPLTQFPHNMEPYLRKLGLPTKLDTGVVTLLVEYVVCREGATLESDQTKLLQLLGIKMALFKLELKGKWTRDDCKFEPY